MDKADGLGQARQNLTDYLRLNSLRNTPERNALLEVVYSTDVPMQAEELARLMTEGGRLRISRATVYNNLRLFEEAGLLRKVFHDFGPVDTAQDIRIAFGPVIPCGRSRDLHEAAFDWMAGRLESWGLPVER